ncbi:aminoacyl-tRNA hydrolase [Myxococcota bacterium]|nr:aminoacyl-tRNA hydrolase [Myxococcota bacterium]
MEADLPVDETVTIPGWELWFTASRAGGPGGQHVNTASTRVTLWWNLTGTTALDEARRARVQRRLATRINAEGVLQVSAEGERSQLANREAARARLAELVAAALVVPKARHATRPTRGSKERRLTAKKARGDLKRQRQDAPESP